MSLFGSVCQVHEHALYLLGRPLHLERTVNAQLSLGVVDVDGDDIFVIGRVLDQFLGVVEVGHYFEVAALDL